MTDIAITARILFISVPTWVLFSLFRLVMILLGWVLVPVAVLFRAYKRYEKNSIYGEPIEVHHFTWRFMYAWDNWEDGIAAGWQYRNMGTTPKQIIYWSCLRNPANNLRRVKWLSCDIFPNKVRFTGTFGDWFGESWSAVLGAPDSVRQYDTKVPQWFICWHGLYSCWYWQFVYRGELRRLWVGWKIKPTDIYGVTAYRAGGAGFTSQFKAVK